jgi:hypothetical protein
MVLSKIRLLLETRYFSKAKEMVVFPAPESPKIEKYFLL